jgi:hypothetical protein
MTSAGARPRTTSTLSMEPSASSMKAPGMSASEKSNAT